MLLSGKLLLAAAALLCAFVAVHSVTLMSVDIGSEWIKVAVVAPGVPMEIALNKESKRKTPAMIAFRNGERTFGDDAKSSGMKSPSTSYQFLLDLLGKKADHPAVEVFKKRFPYYKIETDPERGTVLFRQDDETVYSVEELVAQLLNNAHEVAEQHSGQRVKDAVISVPPFFNQAERRAILGAAQLAGINVLSLMSSNTAVGLNYGMFRRKEINATVQHILFYDMGSSFTSATVAAYKTIKTKDRGYTETNPELSVIGYGYDRNLGGMEMTLRLRDHLAKKFTETKKTPSDVYASPRAMAKLQKEAERVKTVLSANTEHSAQIEGLLDDEDYRLMVTREEVEAMCADLFERVTAPIDAALISAAIDISVIDQFILVGGATRVPQVQARLRDYWGSELGKNINADEAAAMGAVYRAADLGQGFKVKKFHIKDAVCFPIDVVFGKAHKRADVVGLKASPPRTADEAAAAAAAPPTRNIFGRVVDYMMGDMEKDEQKDSVEFERSVENEEGVKTTKNVKRSLFALLNLVPQKKVMTFNKHTDDFTFAVNYGDLSHLPKGEASALTTKSLADVSVTGVSEVFEKELSDGAEAKGIKAHFQMDDSGILSLTGIEAVFEKNVTVEVEVKEEESTLAKLGSTISKLFSGSEGEEKKDGEKEGEGATDGDKKEEGGEAAEKKEDEKKDEEQPEKKAEEKEGEESTNKEAEEQPKKKKELKSSLTTVKNILNFTMTRLDFNDLEGEMLESSQKKLKAINEAEKSRLEREVARNVLESYVLDAQDKLYQEEYEVASTEDAREVIRKMCTEIDEWLYEDGFDAPTEMYKEKLSKLEALFEPIRQIVREHQERPDAIKALNDMLNASSMFLQKALLPPVEERWFSDSETQTMDKLITDTQSWLEKKEEEQEAAPKNEKPKLAIYEIGEKIGSLDREIKYLVNKAKIVKAKKDAEQAEAKLKAEKEAKEKAKEEKKKKKEQEKNQTLEEEAEAGDEAASASEENEEKKEEEEEEQPYVFEEEADENNSETNKRKDAEEDIDNIIPDIGDGSDDSGKESEEDSSSEHVEL